MEDIAAIDVVVQPPALIEVVTGEKGDPGPPGPAGIPGPHAASHAAGGDDAVDVTGLAGFPGTPGAFLAADGTFAVPPAGDELPTAPLGQVLTSRGVNTAPAFSQAVTLLDAAGGWRLSVLPSGNFEIRRVDGAGVPGGPHVEIDPYSGGLSTIFGGFGALNGNISVKWLTPAQHTLAELMAVASTNVGNLGTISDSTTSTPGAVITGGGTFCVFARWNGTNWIVISG